MALTLDATKKRAQWYVNGVMPVDPAFGGRSPTAAAPYTLSAWTGYALNPLVLRKESAAGDLEREGALVAHRVGSDRGGVDQDPALGVGRRHVEQGREGGGVAPRLTQLAV